jgi:hypothetical protein
MPGQTNFLEPQQAAQPRPVMELLKEFAKTPGLENYANAGDRIELLTTYLWVRQLTPALPFETFLQLYAPLADYNPENCKHPADAIKSHCPRRAADVPAGQHQWTAAEIVDFTVLYVDMIREAERVGQPVPLVYEQFLARLKEGYLRGDFKEPEPAPTPKVEKPKKTKTTAPTETVAVRPTAANQRVLYTIANEGNRQVRGVVQAITADEGSDRKYVTFMSDAGEIFNDVNILHTQVIDDPLCPGEPDTQGQIKQEAQRQTLTIPKSVAPAVRDALKLTTAMANIAPDAALWTYAASFGDAYEALVDVVNDPGGPYVDARLVQIPGDKIVAELPPRKNIEGEYRFPLEHAVLILDVKVRE